MVLTLAHGADFNLPAEMEVSLSRQRNVKVHWTLIECRANHWEVKPSRQTRRHSAMHYFINFPLRLRLADAQKGCRLMLCSGGDVQGSTESLSAALLSAATWRSISCAVFRAADLPGCQLLSSAAWNLIFAFIWIPSGPAPNLCWNQAACLLLCFDHDYGSNVHK